MHKLDHAEVLHVDHDPGGHDNPRNHDSRGFYMPQDRVVRIFYAFSGYFGCMYCPLSHSSILWVRVTC